VFERFTDRASRVIVLAQEEARRLNHEHVGTEHLLLGLMEEDEGLAARTLTTLGIRPDAVRARVREIVPPNESSPRGRLQFTPRAKRVLELSLREALALRHNHIGTEHILLGLVGEREGVAAQVLAQLGADTDRVRQAVVHNLGAAEPESWKSQRPRCSFCGRTRAGDMAFVAGIHNAYICADCVRAALAIVDDEPGDEPPEGLGPRLA
jgi:ATP-dependent Clp protease ATP-binding subunit ClpC